MLALILVGLYCHRVAAELQNVTVRFYPTVFRQFFNESTFDGPEADGDGSRFATERNRPWNITNDGAGDGCWNVPVDLFTRNNSLQIESKPVFIYKTYTHLLVASGWAQVPDQEWTLGQLIDLNAYPVSSRLRVIANKWAGPSFTPLFPFDTGLVQLSQVGFVSGQALETHFYTAGQKIDRHIDSYEELVYEESDSELHGPFTSIGANAWAAVTFYVEMIRLDIVGEIGCISFELVFLVDVPSPSPTPAPTLTPTVSPTPQPTQDFSSVEITPDIPEDSEIVQERSTVTGETLSAVLAVFGSLFVLVVGVAVGIVFIRMRQRGEHQEDSAVQNEGRHYSGKLTPTAEYQAISITEDNSRCEEGEDSSSYSEIILRSKYGKQHPIRSAQGSASQTRDAHQQSFGNVYDTVPQCDHNNQDTQSSTEIENSEYEAVNAPLSRQEYEAVHVPFQSAKYQSLEMTPPRTEYDGVLPVNNANDYESVETPLSKTIVQPREKKND